MKAEDLDTKEVTVTVTLYILNEKVFELDGCPKWAQWAAVDKDGSAYWYEDEPETDGVYWTSAYECSRSSVLSTYPLMLPTGSTALSDAHRRYLESLCRTLRRSLVAKLKL